MGQLVGDAQHGRDDVLVGKRKPITGRSSSQLFRALAGAPHSGADVGPGWPMNPRMKDPVHGADMPGEKAAGQHCTR